MLSNGPFGHQLTRLQPDPPFPNGRTDSRRVFVGGLLAGLGVHCWAQDIDMGVTGFDFGCRPERSEPWSPDAT